MGQILEETGSILGWAQWNCQECVDCSRPEKSFFGCLVLERTRWQRGLAGYNLTIWIRETQLNLLRGLEGAGAASCRQVQVRMQMQRIGKPRQGETRGE